MRGFGLPRSSKPRRLRERHRTALIGGLPGAALLLATASAAAEQSPERTVLLRGETGGAAPTFADAERADERRLMVDEQIAGRGLSDKAVLAAMRQVPRHRFLSRDRRERAYHDRPLPIGHGQTIS